ncbi:MAG: hypothetical protein JW943_17555 [Deltaproteobacteria bacterium]|nr:hypothetical protein [Deltaproteobacteria bacterium]
MQHKRLKRIFCVSILLALWVVSGSACSRYFVEAADELAPSAAKAKTRGNLHIHTTCSDGLDTYEDMVQYALILNFGFIAVTDHTFGGSALCNDVISQCAAEKRLLCIPGMEVTGKVHLLAIGIRNEIDKRLTVKQQVEEIHQQGGLAIAAHPFRSDTAYTDEELFETGLDAVECKGIPANREKDFYDKLKERNIPCVYNTDAHMTTQMILIWNVCDGEIKSLDDLKKALKTGKCRKR